MTTLRASAAAAVVSARPLVSLLVLAAVGASSTPAAAEDTVQVYGTFDVTTEMVRSSAVHASGQVSSNGSFIGFRGRELLAPNLSAIFQIEGLANIDNGSGGLNSRDTFVGLAGSAGTVKLGLLTTPMRAMGGRVNFHQGASSIANNIGLFTTLNGVQTNLNARLPNALQYATPVMGGVVATVVMSPGENKASGRNDFSRGAGVTYDVGAVSLAYAYEARHAQQKLALGASIDWGRRVAARYVFGHWSVGGGWDRLGSDGLYGSGAATGTGSIVRDAWTAGAMYASGAQDVMLHYTVARAIRCQGSAASGQCDPRRIALTGARHVSLLYHYTLSKRSQLQAFYTGIRNDAFATYDFDVNPMTPDPAARLAGVNPTGVGVGIRHSF